MTRPALLVAYRALSDLAGKAAFFLVTVVAARRLPGDGFGVFSLGTTVGWLAAITADFGMQLHLAGAVARQPADAHRLLRRWSSLRLWTGVLSVALVAAGLAASGYARGHALAIVLLSVAYAANGLIEFLFFFYRGLSRSDIESTVTLGQRGATLVIAVAALWWRPDVTVLAAALAAPALVSLAVSGQLAWRMNGPTPAERVRPEPPLATEFWRDAMPLGAAVLLSATYFRIDVFLVEWWRGASAVGLYSSVFRLVEALRLFPAAVIAVALPTFFRATTGRPIAALAGLLTLGATAGTAVLWFAAGWLVPLLYGPQFVGAVPVFRILLLSFPFMSLNYALTHQVIGWGGRRAYAAICAAALLCNVAANARLIPQLSIAGAAWSTLLTECVVTIGCGAVLWSRGERLVHPSVAAAEGNS